MAFVIKHKDGRYLATKRILVENIRFARVFEDRNTAKRYIYDSLIETKKLFIEEITDMEVFE